jgi:hypothetical protein
MFSPSAYISVLLFQAAEAAARAFGLRVRHSTQMASDDTIDHSYTFHRGSGEFVENRYTISLYMHGDGTHGIVPDGWCDSGEEDEPMPWKGALLEKLLLEMTSSHLCCHLTASDVETLSDALKCMRPAPPAVSRRDVAARISEAPYDRALRGLLGPSLYARLGN